MELTPVFALLNFAQFWLAIPLSVAFALCYAATRSEEPRAIFLRAARIAAQLAFFLALGAGILRLACP